MGKNGTSKVRINRLLLIEIDFAWPYAHRLPHNSQTNSAVDLITRKLNQQVQ